MVELAIADSGSGLTDDMRERLFLPYFSTKQRGTGLGLAIAAKIIQEHQGTIRAEKNEPAGARFIIELRPALSSDSDSEVLVGVDSFAASQNNHPSISEVVSAAASPTRGDKKAEDELASTLHRGPQ